MTHREGREGQERCVIVLPFATNFMPKLASYEGGRYRKLLKLASRDLCTSPDNIDARYIHTMIQVFELFITINTFSTRHLRHTKQILKNTPQPPNDLGNPPD